MKKTLDLAEMDAQAVTALPDRELPALVTVIALNGVEIFLPVNAAANVCNIDVNVLSADLADGFATCDAAAEQHASRSGR
jgi:hypothetical protein